MEITKQIEDLLLPIAQAENVEIVDIEYVKEELTNKLNQEPSIEMIAKELGLSATSEKEELFCTSVKLRTDIVNLLSTRREQRRTRRSRLRYRKTRFLNRVKAKKPGWIAPSIQNKIQFHIKMVEFVNKILPIFNMIY